VANATEIKFGDPDNRIAQLEHWTVLLRPKQVTLGALVLVCREPVTAFADVSPDAFAELKTAVAGIERVLQALTGYERINYLMLMMVDPDVHYHVIPRYGAVRQFDAVDFPDAGWPGPPVLDAAVSPSDTLRVALVERLRTLWVGEA